MKVMKMVLFNAITKIAFMFSCTRSSFVPKASVATCSNLATSLGPLFETSGVKITSTTLRPPNATAGNTYEYCAVVGIIHYTPSRNDSLSFNVFLPDPARYTGRFMAVGQSLPHFSETLILILINEGNGGLAGTIDTEGMLAQLESGFAVAGWGVMSYHSSRKLNYEQWRCGTFGGIK